MKQLYSGDCSCKHPCGKVINLMVAGQTGAGKTTLIDSFTNFLLNVELYDTFRYKLVDERDLIDSRQKHAKPGATEKEKA